LEFLADILLKYGDYDDAVVNSAFNALKTFRRGADDVFFKKTNGLKELHGEVKDMVLDILSDYCDAPPDWIPGVQSDIGDENDNGKNSADITRTEGDLSAEGDGRGGEENHAARIRQAVVEGFLESGNIMLYANLLGRCGDGGSIAVLKEYAGSKTLKKAEFLEIRNAVERLGGFMREF
jgi:hypothetical protein